ncbi:MAG: hypothetical protein RLZZ86_3600, partial [Cyanobacteriota bacterium]
MYDEYELSLLDTEGELITPLDQ